jgi:glutaminyl-tRNA synthetase
MPTLAAMRRRGYPPEAIRRLVEVSGVTKSHSVVELALLEHVVRDDLNARTPRVMAVLRPLRVVIENYPADKEEAFDIATYPQDKESTATRRVPFGREIYIERDDFEETPPPKFFRLAPGREVRLMGAYYITCTGVVSDEAGEVVELRCTYDPESRGGQTADGRKVKGTLHWVPAAQAVPAEVRLYDTLFRSPNPGKATEDGDITADLNPESLEVLAGAMVEPSLASAAPGDRFQFTRQGYFAVDTVNSRPERPVFNRIVTLRDTWAKQQG